MRCYKPMVKYLPAEVKITMLPLLIVSHKAGS